MREYKFRGKIRGGVESLSDFVDIPHDENGWVYGHLVDGHIVWDVVEATEEFIAPEWWVAVDRKTIGQYTGLKDKNGAEIFEGDILQIKIYNSFISDKVVVSGNAAVEFRDDRFGVQWGREFAGLSGFYNTTFEIIGNAHDNPALLGASESGVAE